ncbi:MAG: hypothetical protein RMK35_00115 [Aquificaceae bacterium]|nr:hypothetical protein [Aquificaceae bacterium]MDW8433188.1 hypothetical protein [Aquificaceae bacterium]
MGVFIEDLMNFGNLIDTELEIKLSAQELATAYPELDFEIKEGILRIFINRRVLFWNRKVEVRLSEGGGVKKDRENQSQWVFFKVLSKAGLEDILKLDAFRLDGEYVGMEVMKAVSLTESYRKIPRQFLEKLLINRYKMGKDSLSVFFRFEK